MSFRPLPCVVSTAVALVLGWWLIESATAQVYGPRPTQSPPATWPQIAPAAAQQPNSAYPAARYPAAAYPAGDTAQPARYPAPAPGAYPNQGVPGYGTTPGQVMPMQYQQQMPASQSGAVAQPVYGQQPGDDPRLAQQPARPALPPIDVKLEAAQPGEHPLAPAVRWAKAGLARIDTIQDYSCTMVKREQIDGNVGEREYMFLKVRHRPFSAYIYFLAPDRVKGQEAMYVEGQNGGNMLAHANGARHKLFGTVSLSPTGMLAMNGNRYPITEIGVRRLTERLVQVGQHDMQYGECEVKVQQGAKINGRDCTCLQVVHPVPRREFTFYLARIYVDTELNLPIRYEAYDWPESPGAVPKLQEEYTYLNLKLNNGFTDADFDVANPNYQFQ